jgi:hypothetical protein
VPRGIAVSLIAVVIGLACTVGNLLAAGSASGSPAPVTASRSAVAPMSANADHVTAYDWWW